MAVIHETTFERNTRTGDWRARCSCGWFLIGECEHVQMAAAGHDLEWEAVSPDDDNVLQWPIVPKIADKA